MGHSVGISDSYYRATESELLDDYLKAIDLLTINEESRLRNKVKVLEVEKSRLDQLEFTLKRLKEKYYRKKPL
ncbi:MAG: hypothetical protein ACRD93_03930 [Nitrososphaeraceae archaeon]